MSEYALVFSFHFRAVELAGARAERRLFEGVSFALSPGDALLVTGPNGAGKSTLLRVLAGLIRPAGGNCWLAPEASDDAVRCLYLGHGDAVKGALTVERNLAFWSALAGLSADAAPQVADKALAAFALEDLADIPARLLSVGQKRRLALARLLVSPAPLWLLDEPTTALDTASARLVAAVVAEHRAEGGITVIATHQPLTVPDAKTLHMEPAL